MNDFYAIAKKHCPSKLDMGYCRHLYGNYLEPRRQEALTLLEIGIKRGNSLTMFEEYFPNATIVGLDVLDCTRVATKRIKVYVGSQDSESVLSRICKDHPRIDIVVDDGSHRARHQIASFKCLFPRLPSRAIYFIEDLHFFTHKHAPESWVVKDGHVTKHLFVQYMKKLSDFVTLGPKHNKMLDATDEDRAIGETIKAVHFHGKMIVVEKL